MHQSTGALHRNADTMPLSCFPWTYISVSSCLQIVMTMAMHERTGAAKMTTPCFHAVPYAQQEYSSWLVQQGQESCVPSNSTSMSCITTMQCLQICINLNSLQDDQLLAQQLGHLSQAHVLGMTKCCMRGFQMEGLLSLPVWIRRGPLYQGPKYLKP